MFRSETTAKIITDSSFVAEGRSQRIVTFELRYPRIVHGELMTHRVFSRNAGSSRAIKIERFIKQVREDTAKPVAWTLNEPGMQGKIITDPKLIAAADAAWLKAAYRAADTAEEMSRMGLHKQVVNRVLEPYQWISVIVTATDFANWFALRDHGDADPTIQDLAARMRVAIDSSTPDTLAEGEWHIPYLTLEERAALKANPGLLEMMLKFSTARCARVSYLTHDGENPSQEKDLNLFARLVERDPRHASPIEHQARAANCAERVHGRLSGNFSRYFVQHRKLLEHSHNVR